MDKIDQRIQLFDRCAFACVAVAFVLACLCLRSMARGQDVLLPVYEASVGQAALTKAEALGKAQRLWLIINPNSGPGTKPDAAYTALLKRAQKLKARTLAYVDLMAWPGDGLVPKSAAAFPKTSAMLTAERLSYARFYPGLLRGWFLDDVAPSMQDSLQLVSTWEGAIVLNPGCSMIPPAPLRAAMVVISEQAEAWPRELTPWERSHRQLCAVMGLSISSARLPAFMESTAGMALRYASPLDDQWRKGASAYTTLTPYLETLLK